MTTSDDLRVCLDESIVDELLTVWSFRDIIGLTEIVHSFENHRVGLYRNERGRLVQLVRSLKPLNRPRGLYSRSTLGSLSLRSEQLYRLNLAIGRGVDRSIDCSHLPSCRLHRLFYPR